MTEPDEKVKNSLVQFGIEHEVLECNPDWADTAAFCEHYGKDPGHAANTIIVASKKVEPTKYCACVVLAPTRLDVNKKVCQMMGIKRASFASAEQTMELTGMMIGGVVVFGLPADLPIYVDTAVLEQSEVIMGGGNRSSKLLLNPQELKKLPNVQVIENLASRKD